jgi:class 3 adenylate cyclase/tetratricopeptide (TPR) repeat protein
MTATTSVLLPYLPRLTVDWLRSGTLPTDGGAAWQAVDGTLVFGDVSGFTKMSERLARHGKVGAEEVADAINACFEQLLAAAYSLGGSLLKFGGDAMLLLFAGDGHAERAARAAVAMRSRLRVVGRLDTTAGRVVLRISIGVHTGRFHLFLVGDSHKELVIAGPGASATVEAEGTATAGEIVMTAATAAVLPARCRGARRGEASFLLRAPNGPDPTQPIVLVDDGGIDISSCTPRTIRRHLLRGGAEPEHRIGTVAFLHFDGTDDWIAARGPDALADALDAVVRAVQEEVDEREVTFLGTDIDHDGGKIILVSGVPTRVGEDEQRMLSALRRIADRDLPLHLRIGANTGPVFSGDVGTDYRRTYTVMGDTVNLAARLMARAAPSEALVTADLLERSRLPFETVALAPFMVKGKKRPVHAFALGAPKRLRDRRTDTLPLVGREAEIAMFDEAIDGLRGGVGHAFEITADAGLGKSRLVEELRSRAEARADEIRCVTIVCEEYEVSTPYAPFWLLGRHLLGFDGASDREAVRRQLRARVTEVMPQQLDWLPLLGTVFDLDFAETQQTAGLDPEFRRQRTDEAMAAFVHLALHGPALLVFEDVHFMDEASEGLVRRLAAGIDDGPMLLCLTRRESSGTLTLAPDLQVDALQLAPLTVDDAARAITLATADAPLMPQQVRQLAMRSGGNPLFIDELLAAFVESGDADSLPDSIEATITAQIDRLPPNRRQMLRCAAVLGRFVAVRELDELLAPDLPPVDPATIRELDEFLVVDRPGVLRFRQTLMRDAAYEGLPFRRRRELHARAGDLIARKCGDAAASEAELLSLHFFHAHRYRDALGYSRMAAERAADKYANVDAAKLFERAVTSAQRVADVGEDELAQIWEALGDVRERAAAYDAARRAYNAARRLRAGDPAAQAGLLLKAAWIAERLGRYSEAVRWVRKGQRLLDGLDGPEVRRRRAELASWYATIRQSQGRYREAIKWSHTALALAVEAGELRAEAQAALILDWAWVSVGRRGLATYSQRALEIYAQLADVRGESVVLGNMGAFAYWAGDWAEALSLYERSRDAANRIGADVGSALSTSNIGEVFADQGRFDIADTTLREALRIFRAAGYRYGIGRSHALLGRVAARQGRYDEADKHFGTAREAFVSAELDADVKELDGRVAERLALEHRAAEALTLATNTLRVMRAQRMASELPLLQRVRGCALLQLGRRDEAQVALTESLELAKASESDYEIAMSMAAVASAAELAGDLATARSHETDIARLFDKLGVERVSVIPMSTVAGTTSSA